MTVSSQMRCACGWRAWASTWLLICCSAASSIRRRDTKSPLRFYANRFGWLLFLALACSASEVFAEGTVRDVTLLPNGEGVRIVVDLGRKVPFEQRTVDNPPRLVLDLPDVSWQLPRQRGKRSFRFIQGFRFGQLQDGISRLVVDIDRPFMIEKVFELPPNDTSGHRIVTDVLPLPPGSAMQLQQLSSKVAVTASPPPLPQAKPREDRRSSPIALRSTHLPAPKPRFKAVKRMIVLDPGHGGIDPGASGKQGTYEKNVVLSAALELRRQLLDTGRYDVVLTRGDDSFVRLRDRLQIARVSGGHLFISLHADSLASADDVRGAAVYTLSNQASSEEAARLATNENRADILGGIDLSHHEQVVTQILIDLAQRDANTKSLRIADILVEELATAAPMLRKQQQQAGFVVLKSPDMPSVLIELGYLSNVKDEKRLNDPDHLADLANVIIDAIDRYFQGEQS